MDFKKLEKEIKKTLDNLSHVNTSNAIKAKAIIDVIEKEVKEQVLTPEQYHLRYNQ